MRINKELLEWNILSHQMDDVYVCVPFMSAHAHFLYISFPTLINQLVGGVRVFLARFHHFERIVNLTFES